MPAETDPSSSAYPITDALGSVRALTGSSGSISASASYDVFGAVRSSSGSVGSLGYTGALSDSSGLLYLQARSLDPASGTFTSRDPLTPGGPGITGFNPYTYAAQNPTTYSDPSGQTTLESALTRTIGAMSRPAVTLVGDALVSEILWSALSLLLAWELTQAVPRTLPWPGTRPGMPDIPDVRSLFGFPANLVQGLLGELKAFGLLYGVLPWLFFRFHVYFPVPGYVRGRFLDICAYRDPISAYSNPLHPLFSYEVKTGNSPYVGTTQEAKDRIIVATYHFPIHIWYVPLP